MKPISNTAFYCCGVRMQDAENEKPVCGDIYAKEFMDERGLNILSSFAAEKNPNAGNVARHRIIDDYLRKALSDNPELAVFIIGAGFDSRAYRLNGGRWIELDEPQIIAYKNERLPVEQCRNKLQRIAIDFETESLADKLQQFSTDQPVVLVFEGVFIYLPENVIQQNLRTLQSLFPEHALACDLMTEKFYKKYSHSLGKRIGKLGAGFMFTSQKPTEVFCNANYRIAEKHSVIGKAIEFGSIKVPMLIFKTFLKTLERGYSIYIFEAGL
jgi:methyltransferase (TIGR00027 family)